MYSYTRSDFLNLNNRPDKLDPPGVVRGEKPFRTILALPTTVQSALKFILVSNFRPSDKRGLHTVCGII